MDKRTLQLTYSGLMAALTFISTSILAFPVAFTNGYIHLGDGFVMSCGVILGKRNGALAAGIGSALADIYLGYASWALPTFIIKALMAYLVGYIYEDLSNKGKLFKLITAFSVLWVSFMVIVGRIIGTNKNVVESTDALITEGLIADITELGFRTSFTVNTIIISIIIIPILFLGIFFLVKNNKAMAICLNKFSAFLMAGTLTIILYYISAGIMYGNWTVPVFSVPSNLLQYIIGIVIATALLPLTTRVHRQLVS